MYDKRQHRHKPFRIYLVKLHGSHCACVEIQKNVFYRKTPGIKETLI